MTDLPSVAIEAGRDAIFMAITHYDTPMMDGSELDFAVAEDAEHYAEVALTAASERIECPAPADWHQLGCACGGSGFFFILRHAVDR